MDKQKDVCRYVIEYSLNAHTECFHDPQISYLTIVDDQDTVAGYIILVQEDDGSSIEFRRIVIDENKRGVGQAAIQLMEEFCARELKAKRIWLDVFAHNSRGLHVYRKLGYTKFKEGECQGKKLLYFEKVL